MKKIKKNSDGCVYREISDKENLDGFVELLQKVRKSKRREGKKTDKHSSAK